MMELKCGKVDPNENPLNAAYRESYEEGWNVENINPTPIHKDHINGKLIWWFMGNNPQKLSNYKEINRIKPIIVSKKQIANSGYGNEFISNLNNNIKNENIMNIMEKIILSEIDKLYENQYLNEVELPNKIRSDSGKFFTVYKNPPSIKNMSDRIRAVSTPDYDLFVVDDTTHNKEILHEDIFEYLFRYEGIPSNVNFDGSTDGYYCWIKLHKNVLHLATSNIYSPNLNDEYLNEYITTMNNEHPNLKFIGK